MAAKSELPGAEKFEVWIFDEVLPCIRKTGMYAILDKNNIPYQQFVDSGYFRVLEKKYTVSNGQTKINIKTMVFQKGIDFILRKIREQ